MMCFKPLCMPLAAALSFSAITAAAQVPAGFQPVHEVEKETLRAKLDSTLPVYRPQADPGGNIRVAGNLEHMEPLLRLWIAAYQEIHPDTTFTFDTKHDDSGKAIPAMVEGAPDLTLIGREMKDAEIATFQKKYGYPPFIVSISAGSFRVHGKSFAPVFFVNKENPLAQISLDQLDGIYSKTRRRGSPEITTWGQLGVTGPWATRPIHLYGLDPAAGTRTYLKVRLLKDGDWKDGIKTSKYEDGEADWTELVNFVGDDPLGIAYASAGHTIWNPKVKNLGLSEQTGGPYVSATFANVADQRYPLSRFAFLLLNRKPGTPVDPKVKEFLEFIYSKQGQQCVIDEGDYLPLASGIAMENRRKLD
jgi:phosphate transport system substrate-binding protein